MSENVLKYYKLGEVITIFNGTKYDHLNEGNIPLYGSGGLMSYVDDFLYNGKAILLPRKGTLDNIMYVDEAFWTVDTMYYATVNSDEVNDYYLYSYLSILNLANLDSGSTLPSMTKTAYQTIDILLPAKVKQDKVARLLFVLDQKIALNNQINEELEAMAKTLYDYWFVQFDFPDENGKPYKSSGGKMVYNDQLKREIPEGWGVETLSGLGTIVGGSTPSKSNLDNFVKSGQGISWITPNDLSKNKGNKFISKGDIDISEVGRLSANLKVFPKGTVLLSSRAPIGYLAIASNELTTNQGFKSFIPNKEYDENYIYYVIKQSMKVIEQNASGSTFKEISSTVLGEILVVKPHNATIKLFQENVVNINNQIYVNEAQNQELTQLRDWLLPMLMNGQVKVEDKT